jgi:hypothetical protein
MVFFLSKCLIFNSRFLQSGFVVHRSFNQENHCYANQENFFMLVVIIIFLYWIFCISLYWY